MNAHQPRSISVLMATYGGEKAGILDLALDSTFFQTLPARECVLVLDGPVGDDQEAVIKRYERFDSPRLVVVRLGERQGLGRALNAGLERCEGDLIARMDSDDVCFPTRFERQCRIFDEMPEVDVVCAVSTEFERDPTQPVRIKPTPEYHDDLVAVLKYRNTICHPSVMLPRSLLGAVGGYRDCFDAHLRGELTDYDLYVRLILAGARFYAVQEPLLAFRVGLAQSARRGGWRYAKRELAFRRYCHQAGFLSTKEFVAALPLQLAFRLIPARLRGRLYRLVRSSPEAA